MKINLKKSSENILILFKGKGCTFREIVQALLSPYFGLLFKETVLLPRGANSSNLQFPSDTFNSDKSKISFWICKMGIENCKMSGKSRGKSQRVLSGR